MANDTRLLILGAGGFIGQHLVSELQKQDNKILELAGIGLSCFSNRSRLRLIDGEINRSLLNACNPPDIIYYLAGGSSVGESVANPSLDFYRTIPPLQDLLDKIRVDWTGTRIVYISSAAVYGKSATDSTSSTTKLSPVSPYGLHKMLAEQLIDYYVDHYEINISIIRPFSVYGPGLRKQLLWDALQKIAQNEFLFFGSGEERRDWVYVLDLVRFMIDVANNASCYPRVTNAGSGIATSVNNILTELFSLAGYSQRPIFKDEAKPGDPNHLVADFSEQMPYMKFFSTPLKDGLKEVVSWHKKVSK